MADVALHEMLHPHVVIGQFRRYGGVTNLFQRIFRMRVGDPPTATVLGKVGQAHLTDPVRRIGSIRMNTVGPRRIDEQEVGGSTVTCYRSYESVRLLDERLYPLAALGGPPNVLEEGGVSYVNEQLSKLAQSNSNLREFVISRLLMGGFGLKLAGGNMQNIIPVEKGNGTYDFDSGIPAANTGAVPLSPTGSNIIDTGWQNAGASIVQQMNNLNEASLFVSGKPLRHNFITTSTYNLMLGNTELRSVGGDAFTIWRDFTMREVLNDMGDPNAGFTVQFRAMPNFLFHVYDGFLMLDEVSGTATTQRDQRTWQAGTEPIRRNQLAASEIVRGFQTWSTPMDEPPGEEFKLLDIGIPFLKMQQAVFHPTVDTS